MALLELTKNLNKNSLQIVLTLRGSIVGDHHACAQTDDLAEEVKLNGNKIDSDKTYSSAEWRVGCIYTDDSRNEQVGQPHMICFPTYAWQRRLLGCARSQAHENCSGQYSADVRYQQNRYVGQRDTLAVEH